MYLSALSVRHFRSLSHVELALGPAFNLFTGPNGAGKTSLLEAVHCLAQGKSFLPVPPQRLVQHGRERLLVRATVQVAGGGPHRLGLERGSGAVRRVLDGRHDPPQAALAARLPLLVLVPDSVQLVSGPPSGRRALLDWGLFYARPDFLPTWRRYRLALRQRNALLRTARPDWAALAGWERVLAEAGERLHRWRAQHAADLAQGLAQVAGELALPQPVELHYGGGWPDGLSLAEALARGRTADRQRGFTRHGPHRGDLLLRVAGRPAAQHLSRGQQRILVILLRLAQARFHVEHTGRPPVFLVDDLAAELDRDNHARMVAALVAAGVQCLVTGTGIQSPPDLPGERLRRFHVEQGQVREVV